MAVEIVCGNCGKPFGVQPEWAGLAVQCPFCEAAVQVPLDIAAASDSPPAEKPPASNELVRIDTDEKTASRDEAAPTLEVEDRRVSRRSSKKSKKTTHGSVPQEKPTDGGADHSKSRGSRDERWKAPPGEKSAPEKSGSPDSTATTAKSAKSEAASSARSKSTKQKPRSPKPVKKNTSPGKVGESGNSTSPVPKKPMPPDFKELSTAEAKLPATGMEETISAPLFFPVENSETSAEPRVELERSNTNSAAESASGSMPTPLRPSGSIETPPQEQASPEDTDEAEAATPAVAPPPGVSYRVHSLRFPPTYREAQDASKQVDIVVRSGVKEIDYNGEKVIVRDDQSLLNVYQIVGFIFSLIILVLVLIWSAFFR